MNSKSYNVTIGIILAFNHWNSINEETGSVTSKLTWYPSTDFSETWCQETEISEDDKTFTLTSVGTSVGAGRQNMLNIQSHPVILLCSLWGASLTLQVFVLFTWYQCVSLQSAFTWVNFKFIDDLYGKGLYKNKAMILLLGSDYVFLCFNRFHSEIRVN